MITATRPTSATNVQIEERLNELLLSTSQQSRWLCVQRSPSSAQHVIARLRFHGSLNSEALRAALNLIVARHQVLRTTFHSTGDDSMPVARLTAADCALLEHDVASDAEVEQICRQEALDPFDLSLGPLIRGRLLRLPEDEHVLLITQHRLVSDVPSMWVLLRELSSTYSAFTHGRGNPLPPLDIQYAGYVGSQRQHMTKDVLDRQLQFWTRTLADAPTPAQLPTDHPRRGSPRGPSARLRLKLPTALVKRLMQLARQQRVSLFETLLSGWAVLVGRWCGEAEVLMGTNVVKRHLAQTPPSIGPIENTLVLRIGIQPDWTVELLLKHVKAVMADARAHQDVPLEMVINALDPSRGHNPPLQLRVAMNDAVAMHSTEVRLAGLRMTEVSVESTDAQFDLSLSMSDALDGLTATLEYDSELFERQTVERMAACWHTLLKGMAKHAQRPIDRVAWLPATERWQVLYGCNQSTALPCADALIHTLFEQQVERAPDVAAVTHDGQSLTYAELNGRANQLARYLREKGVGADQLVGICVERSIEMVVALLAILKAGAAYVPLDPSYPSERLAHMLRDAAPRMVLTQKRLTAVLPEPRPELIELDEAAKECSAYSNGNLCSGEMGPGAPYRVYVIYTSGSTGQPKGTEMAHRSMVNLIEWHRESFANNERKRVLQFAALSFDVSFQETFTTLCSGGSLVLLDEWVRRDVRALAELLSRHGINRLFVPPLMLQRLAEFALSTGIFPAHLEEVITAGEQLRITAEIIGLFKRLDGCRLHNHYGPTESHVVTSLTLTGDSEAWPRLPTIGQPIANTQLYVLDQCRQPVPMGVSGEIYIGGANVACGYLNKPRLTAERFISDPFSSNPGARLYKSGDLGRWRSDGMLEYLGRNDDQVKIRGFRVELTEIEAQLARHPRVKDTAVVARADEAGKKSLIAYVTARAETRPDAHCLRTFLKAALPEHMVPSAFVVLDHLPLTPSGKLDRRALPTPDHAAYVSRPYTAPHGDTEILLAGVWRELLPVEQVGREDHFFELGGDSIAAMHLVARLRSHLSIEMPMSALFEHPTIARLSPQVERLREATISSDIAADEGDVADLLERVTSMSDGQVQALLRKMTIGGGRT